VFLVARTDTASALQRGYSSPFDWPRVWRRKLVRKSRPPCFVQTTAALCTESTNLNARPEWAERTHPWPLELWALFRTVESVSVCASRLRHLYLRVFLQVSLKAISEEGGALVLLRNWEWRDGPHVAGCTALHEDYGAGLRHPGEHQ
jgi:hypothetical protein